MNKNIFNQIEIQGKSYSVIVATRFGTQLCSASGDMVFHTTPILTLRDADSGQAGMTKQFEQTRKLNQLSSKRRK